MIMVCILPVKDKFTSGALAGPYGIAVVEVFDVAVRVVDTRARLVDAFFGTDAAGVLYAL